MGESQDDIIISSSLTGMIDGGKGADACTYVEQAFAVEGRLSNSIE